MYFFKVNLAILFLIFLLATSASFGNDCELNRGFGLGFQINQNQNDFGLGLNFNSPYFFNSTAAIRLKGNFMFYEHEHEGLLIWTDYRNVSLGIIGVLGKVGDHIKLYGELGSITLFPSKLFSTKTIEGGWYGLFGFEFYVNRAINYFLDIGATDIGARADRFPLEPIYSNGFLINAGIRIHLKPVKEN
jgi:hypothetical protein